MKEKISSAKNPEMPAGQTETIMTKAMKEAETLRRWFQKGNKESWKGKALEAFTGAGRYSGRMSAENGYKTFRFRLERNSFTAFLKKLEKISDDPGNMELVRLTGSPARASGNLLLGNPIKASVVNGEISWLTEGDLEKKVNAVREALLESGKKLDLFNIVDLKEGHPVEMIRGDEHLNDARLMKALDELTGFLKEQFEPFIKETGAENPDGLVITTSHYGYDKDDVTYGVFGEETRATYDDENNVAIVQTAVDSDDLAE